jgi:hypothetical protein
LRNNINFVYDDEIEKDIQYLYEAIRSVIPSNCDIRHTWDVNTVVQILEQYMMQHLPTWDKFIKLFYEFIQYDISDVDYDKAKNCYEEYIFFMEMHGDIVKNYIAMEDNLEQYMQENSLAFGSHNGKEKLIFSSPLVIKEYDDSIYTATVAKGTNAYREEAYEYLKVTPCMKRHIIDDFVRNGDSDGLWNFLKRFNFDCEYQE